MNIYVNGLEPSKNNVLTAVVTKENALSAYFEPVEVSYDAFYDDRGLIFSYYRHSDPGQTSEEFVFQKALYDCK